MQLDANVSKIVSRSLDEELALSEGQRIIDNSAVAALQTFRLSRGSWKQFGANRSVADLFDLPPDQIRNLLSASGEHIEDLIAAAHHVAAFSSKALADPSSSGVKWSFEWSQSRSEVLKVHGIYLGAFGHIFFNLGSEEPLLVHAEDIRFAPETRLAWITELFQLLSGSGPGVVVVRRSRLEDFVAEAISKSLLLLDSRSEDDFAPAAREVASWRASTPFAPFTCGYCYREAHDLLRCGRCKKTSYCNEECQRVDWKSHKISCK